MKGNKRDWKKLTCFLSMCGTTYHDGICIVCCEACSTKACRCSCMHKECASLYVKKISPTCRVCSQKISTWRLERCPPSKSTHMSEEKQSLTREAEIARKYRIYRSWRNIVWPHVACVIGVQQIDAHDALVTIERDTAHQAAIKQCMMDGGLQEVQANNLLKDMIWTSQNYHTLDDRLQRVIQTGLKRRTNADYSWI